MAVSSAELVVGAGNTFSYSSSRSMGGLLQPKPKPEPLPSPNSNPNRVLLQTDTAALLTYSCDSAAGCQLSTEVRYPSPSPSGCAEQRLPRWECRCQRRVSALLPGHVHRPRRPGRVPQLLERLLPAGGGADCVRAVPTGPRLP
eukprot:scaffold16849_cov57-Phaeocystis_antarctica.AAC.1